MIRLPPVGPSWTQIFMLQDFSQPTYSLIAYTGQVLVRLLHFKPSTAQYLSEFASLPCRNEFLDLGKELPFHLTGSILPQGVQTTVGVPAHGSGTKRSLRSIPAHTVPWFCDLTPETIAGVGGQDFLCVGVHEVCGSLWIGFLSFLW